MIFNECSPSSDSDNGTREKPNEARLRAEREFPQILVSGPPLHFKVRISEQIAASSDASWVRQVRSVFAYKQIRPNFWSGAGRNNFEAESWAQNIDLAVYETGRKAAVTKNLWKWRPKGF